MSVSTDYRARLFAALNVAGVTGLLGAYGTGKALFQASVIPTDCAALNTINYYQVGSVQCADPAPVIRVSVNCRAETEGEAYTIARAVAAAVNQVSFTDYYMTCVLNQVLPPADDTDVFNVPGELTFKKR